MKVVDSFDIFLENDNQNTVITIGNFDGVHIGHKKLIQTAKMYAIKENMLSVVLTFRPHPLEVVNNVSFSYIFSEEEKDMEMERENIDFFIKYPFTKEFSNINHEDFINLLIKKLNCKIIVVGEDYSFGKNRLGNIKILEKICKEKNIKLVEIKNIIKYGNRVSSSMIRRLLIAKNIKKANEILDKPYYIYGKVVEGNKIGRTIGFPTANIIPVKNKILLPDGVYITKTLIEKNIHDSITNIGVNPTFNNKIRTIETYIFGIDQNLYNKNIKVMFLEWIRGVKKFQGIDELKEQIRKDKKIADNFFEKND